MNTNLYASTFQPFGVTLNPSEINYLSEPYPWIHNLGYTENIPGFLELRRHLLNKGWQEDFEEDRREFPNEPTSNNYTIYGKFEKEFQGGEKSVMIIQNDNSSGIHIWFHDPETGCSGDDDPQMFLDRQKDLKSESDQHKDQREMIF